jgi:sodium-coupled neutral amino acid transporter 9
VLVLTGATAAYQILMTDSLTTLVEGIVSQSGGSMHSAHAYWNHYTIPVVLVVLLFPLLNLKDSGPLIRLNSMGVFGIAFLVFFVIFKSFYHHDFFSDVVHTPQFQPKFYYLAGVLMLSFFVHNCHLSILKNNQYPENNIRDLSIAFVFVSISYLLVGGAGYVAFRQKVETISDFISIFPQTDIMAMVARGFLILQLVSLYPLIIFIIRIQFFGLFLKTQYPGFLKVLIFNLIIAIATTCITIFVPAIGTVLRFNNSFFWFLVVLFFSFFSPTNCLQIHWSFLWPLVCIYSAHWGSLGSTTLE